MSPGPMDLVRSTRRFTLYVSVSLYFIQLIGVTSLLALSGPEPAMLAVTAPLLVAGLGSLGWLHWSLRSLRDPGPLPRRLRPWLVAWLLLTLLGVAGTVAVIGVDAGFWAPPLIIAISFAVTAFAARLPWWLSPTVPMTAALLSLAVLTARDQAAPATPVVLSLLGTGAAYSLVAATFWLSGWMLRVVYALDAARGRSAQLAIAEERLRISRDLHDVFGRTLATVSVKSALAGELARRERIEEAAAELDQIRDIADRAGKEVRQVVAGVRGADLAQELVGARSLLSSAGVRCTVTNRVPVEALDPETGLVLAAVVREGVTNVIRHSRASWTRIELRAQDPDPDQQTRADKARPRTRGVELDIGNDGATARSGSGEGTGLRGMAERLSAAGGRLQTRCEGGEFWLRAFAGSGGDGWPRGATGGEPEQPVRGDVADPGHRDSEGAAR